MRRMLVRMNEEPENLVEGTLISHLLELRDRLVRAMIAVAVAFVPCMFYANQIFTFIADPLREKLPKGTQLIATGVMTPFTTPFKLSLLVAVFIAMPYVLYQVWAFVAPGLYRHEKRFAVPLLVSAIVLFYVGVVFAYFFVFPVMFQFFTSTTPKGVTMMTDISSYLDFTVTMFLAFGAAFEVPVAVVLLVITGVVRLESLRKNRRFVLLGCFVVAAFLTPPDAISQSVMAVPMYLLYEGGILMARFLSKARQENSDSKEAQAS